LYREGVSRDGDMVWVLGSEGREESGTSALPAGTAHAVDPDAGQTGCGRPVRSLHLWPDVPWRRVRMVGIATCPVCDRQVD
jgi:hypothetical protein